MAMDTLGHFYDEGINGLPVDHFKAVELYQRASELGCAAAHYNLGYSYDTGEGVTIDKKKAVHHYQIAAMMGSINARHNLGCTEMENGNYMPAMKHFMIAANGGDKDSLDQIKVGFRKGHVTKDDFETTLRAYQSSCDKTKSEQRDRASVLRRFEAEIEKIC